MIRIKPPRDIESWQRLPVEEIAHARPILLPDTDSAALHRALDACPYQRFPVGDIAAVQGIVTRGEMEAALAEHRISRLLPAPRCGLDTTVRDAVQLLMESASGVLLVRENPRVAS